MEIVVAVCYTFPAEGVKSLEESKTEITYTYEFKKQIIEYMQENELSYRQTEILFNLPEGLPESWDRLFYNEGVEGLRK